MRKLIKFFFLITLFIFSSATPVFAMSSINSPLNEYKISYYDANNPNNINTLIGRGISSAEEVNLYHEKEDVVQVFNHQNQKVFLTKADVNLMAAVVYAESKGEPYEGKVAVASVILNRVVSSSFPNTVKEVIVQKNAFSCVRNGTIPLTQDVNSYKAVYDALSGYDPSNSSCFFYNPKIATCNWMKNINKNNQKRIGNHVFFNV